MDRLLAAGEGLVRIVTLAPECDPGSRVTKMLAGRGVVVSAGHTDASLDQLRAGLDAGLTMFTHVGNGCPMQPASARQHHPARPEPRRSLLAVLHRRRRARAGYGSAATTSASPEPPAPSSSRTPSPRQGSAPDATGWDGRRSWSATTWSPAPPADPTSSGSGATMRACADRLRQEVGLTDGQVRTLTSENPRRARACDCCRSGARGRRGLSETTRHVVQAASCDRFRVRRIVEDLH